MANSYHNLGTLAQERGDHDQAERQYQRSLDIKERIGDQVGMANSISALGVLDAEREPCRPRSSPGTSPRWRSGSPSASRRP